MQKSRIYYLSIVLLSIVGFSTVHSFKGKLFVGSAGLTVAGCILYSTYPSFKAYVDQKAADLKESCINNIAIPAYANYDRIKDEGLNGHDYVVLGALLIGGYTLKRLGGHYHIWRGLRNQNFHKTGAQIWTDGEWAAQNKGLVGSLLLGAASLTWIIKDGRSLSYLERFWYSLTHRQKEVLSEHSDLSELKIHEATDPSVLQDHQLFHASLHDHQKELLEEAIEEYRMNYDPMSLFDDFDDE